MRENAAAHLRWLARHECGVEVRRVQAAGLVAAAAHACGVCLRCCRLARPRRGAAEQKKQQRVNSGVAGSF